MKKVLTIGSGIQDVFIKYDSVETLDFHTKEEDIAYVCLKAGRKIELQDIEYYCGGGATNSAVSFARNGFEVQSFFKIGNDKAGDFIVESLKKNKVSTEHVIRTDEKPTGQSFIIPGPHGNSAVLVYRGANITLQQKELPEDAIKNANQLYITSLSGPTAHLLIPITQMAKKYNVPVAANPGTSQLRAGATYLKEALCNINILILNSYEAELLMTSLMAPLSHKASEGKQGGVYPKHCRREGQVIPELLQKPLGSMSACFTLQQFFNTVHACGPDIIVVTNGSEGVYASDRNSIYFHPSIKINIVSSTGAGDAFGSSFVAQLNHNKSIEDALRIGIINSSSVIKHLGTQNGLLTHDELEKIVAHLDKKMLQKYPLK
jgi:sugar/nucleoside kinase (ribokinase family)